VKKLKKGVCVGMRYHSFCFLDNISRTVKGLVGYAVDNFLRRRICDVSLRFLASTLII
jgi:hypothetical protein